MGRILSFAATTIATVSLALALAESDAFAQGKSLKEQLVGTWTLVSNTSTRPDGSRYEALGPNPRGVFILDDRGHFVITHYRGRNEIHQCGCLRNRQSRASMETGKITILTRNNFSLKPLWKRLAIMSIPVCWLDRTVPHSSPGAAVSVLLAFRVPNT
jgi:hypothetical protein